MYVYVADSRVGLEHEDGGVGGVGSEVDVAEGFGFVDFAAGAVAGAAPGADGDVAERVEHPHWDREREGKDPDSDNDRLRHKFGGLLAQGMHDGAVPKNKGNILL